jgi:hypothetical protein
MSIIPLWLSNDGNLCIFNALQTAYEVSCWAFGCLITLAGLGRKGLFYQSNLANPLISGKQNLLLFQNCPTSLHMNPFQGNPMKKYTKNWVIANKFQTGPTTTHGPISNKSHGKITKKKPGHIIGRTREPFSITVCHCVRCLNTKCQPTNKQILLGNSKLLCF